MYTLLNRIAFECWSLIIEQLRFERWGPRFREDKAILFANLGSSKNVTPADPHTLTIKTSFSTYISYEDITFNASKIYVGFARSDPQARIKWSSGCTQIKSSRSETLLGLGTSVAAGEEGENVWNKTNKWRQRGRFAAVVLFMVYASPWKEKVILMVRLLHCVRNDTWNW